MAKKVKTNNRRRVCRTSGCINKLSAYNLEAYCHAHQQLAIRGYEPVAESIKRRIMANH